jgi:DNA-binding CsgD family transcriptional regulator
MDGLNRLLDVILLASSASGCAAVLAASALKSHPRLLTLAFLLGMFAAEAGLLLATGWRGVPSVVAFIASLIDYAVFPYAFARLACLAGSGEWKGPRAAAYAAYSACCAVLFCAAQAISLGGNVFPTIDFSALRGFLETISSYLLKPAFALGVGFAIVDLVIHVLDCPWPGPRKLLRKTWPLFLGLSLVSLVGAFLGGAGFAYKAIIILGSALTLGESLASMRRERARRTASPASGEPADSPGIARPAESESMEKLGFTGREREAIGLILDGWTYADVARFLSISPTTVKTHVQSCYRKAGAANKLELLRILRRGLPA